MKIDRPIEIQRSNSQILIVSKTSLPNIGFLAFCIAFFGFWYYFLLGLGSIPEAEQSFDYIRARLSAHPFIWLFVLAPVAILPAMYKSLKISIIGEHLSFDGVIHTILKDQKPLARFDEVEHLQVRTREDPEGPADFHRLTAVLRSGKKIEIHGSYDSDEIFALADDVADIVKVKAIRKD